MKIVGTFDEDDFERHKLRKKMYNQYDKVAEKLSIINDKTSKLLADLSNELYSLFEEICEFDDLDEDEVREIEALSLTVFGKVK